MLPDFRLHDVIGHMTIRLAVGGLVCHHIGIVVETLKTPCYTQKSPGYLLYKRRYSRFCPKFRCRDNQGQSL